MHNDKWTAMRYFEISGSGSGVGYDMFNIPAESVHAMVVSGGPSGKRYHRLNTTSLSDTRSTNDMKMDDNNENDDEMKNVNWLDRPENWQE